VSALAGQALRIKVASGAARMRSFPLVLTSGGTVSVPDDPPENAGTPNLE